MKFGEVDAAVRVKLRGIVRESGDRILHVVCECGTELGWTKVSRKPNEQIGQDLVSLIQKQLNIPKQLLVEIVGCSKGRTDYQIARGHGH